MALNADLDRVRIYGDVSGFEDAIREVMHVGELETRDDDPEIVTEVVDVDLDYATLGPKYGGTVGEFDDAIEAGDFELDGEELLIAGERLAPEEFSLREERTYDGVGDMVETDAAVVIVER
jgi:valyl-tRNA synthetase